YNMHYIMVGILNGSFTDDQRKEWLPRIADGDILCGTFSEERGFGGLADTKAVPQPGGGWKLYGKKLWGTLSEVSDIWSGSATITDADGNLPTDFEARVAAESNFIVGLEGPGTAPGLEIHKTWDAMGMKATGTHTLVFDGDDDHWDPSLRPALIGMAKVFSTENAAHVTHKAMRLVGGASYRRGHILEKLYRDAAAGPFQPLTEDQTYTYMGRLELGTGEGDD